MGGAEFPPYWLFGLRWPNTGTYRLFGEANGGTPATPHLCRRHSNTSRYVWFSLLWGHCSFPLGPDVHTTLCVPSKSGISVYPNPFEVLQSNLASLQSLILWEFLLPFPDPEVGKPDVELRTVTPLGRLLWYNCSPVCESPTQWLWDMILLWLCPSYHLTEASPLSLDVGYLFWWVPVSYCWWLFSSYLWCWCSCKRELAHVLLLCHLEQISSTVCAFMQSRIL